MLETLKKPNHQRLNSYAIIYLGISPHSRIFIISFFVIPNGFYFFPDLISIYFIATPGEFEPINWVLSTFFHGSGAHLLSNLFFLLLLGRVVENRVGKARWLLFYFMAGLLSVLGDATVRGLILGDRTPIVGASGAISGLASAATLLSPFRFPISKKNPYHSPFFSLVG